MRLNSAHSISKQALGAAYVYTPQVLLNGKDHRLWRLGGTLGLAPLPAGPAPDVQLQRVVRTRARPCATTMW